MPKRILDGEAMWGSSKLERCIEWAIPEFAWLFPLADANGSFELTNLRVILGKVAVIRPNFTMDVLKKVLFEFEKNGLLFIWKDGEGKTFGHWVGSEDKNRLPKPSERSRFVTFAPKVPKPLLENYLQAYRDSVATGVGLGFGLGFGFGVGMGEAAKNAASLAQNARAESGIALGEQTASDFDIFWDAYPKQVGKKTARVAWRKNQCEGRIGEILASIAAWKQTQQWQDSQFIPYPATWLNQELWKETPPVEENKPNGETKTDQRGRRTADALNRVFGDSKKVAGDIRPALPDRH